MKFQRILGNLRRSRSTCRGFQGRSGGFKDVSEVFEGFLSGIKGFFEEILEHFKGLRIVLGVLRAVRRIAGFSI